MNLTTILRGGATLAFALVILTQLLTSQAQAQLSARPAPMWEGYEKTPVDIKDDEKFIAQAIELAEGNRAKAAQTLINIGWQQIGSNANQAIRSFNQAWLIEPDNPGIFWGFAVASHIRNDELKIVTRWFNETRKLLTLKGLPESARLEADHGRVLATRKCYKEAMPYFEKALSLEPNYVPAHIGMINVARALGDQKLQDKHQKLHDELVK